ncbi:23S rRNA pseudouridine955/2504/2580 synthase/23S rRNA pseudouridine1911/1915/1917 synthase [Chitinophaga sp. YR627]|uniref:RluA family pseudouridine synthase n=1 Tax=Chitinophaga sp. YR627 TaxID=1881041 RepID=UPI0008E94378|nr:RluA family pseudouridine synthase [Chitinophaga sp. YR627]SFN96395.1 23S rRNA pseudouridine955/2504/2580 synthase/23S rRNA pseudouridine1911/1915/1917 synthase [Chitinophaga sp. YR627]
MRINDIIIKETADFVILNKPAGMLTIPDRHDNQLDSLQGLLRKHYGEIFTVHRLDKDTSGVILFAKNEVAHKYYSQLFEGRNVKKFYKGLVNGQLHPETGSVDEAIMEHPTIKGRMVTNRKGKNALTDYQVLEAFGLYSLVQLQIHTGRTHQIRVHMKHLGHPIAVDELYGTASPVYLSAIKKNYKLGKRVEEERPLLSRLGLHAWQLQFKDQQGEENVIEAPLPKDIQAVVTQLRKNSGRSTELVL